MEPTIRLIVGLGNPTPAYAGTRHNVGREFVNSLASENKLKFSRNRQAELIRLPIFIAAKLTSFMNESGPALKSVMDAEVIKTGEILVVVDDFMIPFGSLRLRSGGSSGGHNGLKSIIETLGTEEFARLRVGVGPVPNGQDPADFVLENFSKEEREQLPPMFGFIKNGVDALVADGLQKAMNITNKAYL